MKEIFIPLNVKNRNGRIYTKENLEAQVDEFLRRKKSIGVCYGEFEHPEGLDVSLSKVSHTIENIWFDGNNLMGEIKILNTHYGKMLQDMINNGVKFVVRPRSSGLVDPNGFVHIKKLFTFDAILQEHDSFINYNKELRKAKLNRLSNIVGKMTELTEYYIEPDGYEDLPRPIDDEFHILKNNFLLNE